MNNSRVKITVITVSCNCIDTIKRTIDSVVTQRYNDFEYIIIDGASTDGTIDVLAQYKDKIDYIISEPDDGIYHAMNKGIAAASGDYIIFLNGDDYFDNDGVLDKIADYCDGDNIVIGREYCGSRLSDVVDFESVESKFYGLFYPHQSTFIPKHLFDEYGYYSLNYKVSSDFEWICRAILSGARINWVDVIVSHYSNGGLSSKIGCDIDEYNISLHYLKLSGEDRLINDMRDKACEKARNTVFRQMLHDDSLDDYFRELLDKTISTSNGITLWGGGYLAGLYIEMLKRIDVPIKYIIDKNANDHSELWNIPVIGYSKELVDNLFVTSEFYDSEISSFLLEEGFVPEKDFFSYKYFRNKMIQRLGANYSSVKAFENSTGVAIT